MSRVNEWLDYVRGHDPGGDKEVFNRYLKEIGETATQEEFTEFVRKIRGGRVRPRWITTMIVLQEDWRRKALLRRWLRHVKGGKK